MIEIYRKIKQLIGPHDRKSLHLLQVAVLFLAVFEMSAIGLIAPFMSMMMQPEILETNQYIGYLRSFSGISDPEQFVVAFGVLVFVLYVFTNLYLVCVNWLVIHFSLTQGYKISTRLFSSYLAQNYLFFIKNNSAELSRVIFQDVARLTDGVITPFLMILSRGTSAVAIIALLSIVDIRITLAAALVFGLCYGFIYFNIRNLLVRIGEKFSFYNNQRFRVVSEALGGIKDCKIYGAERYFIDSYRHSSINDANNQIKRRVLLFVPKYLIESVAIGGLLIVSLIFYSRGLSSQLISTISIFAIAAYRLMPSLQQMYSDFSQIKTNKNALDLILENFESVSAESMDGSEALHPAIDVGKIIAVNDLCFAYPESEHDVLRDVSLAISPKTIVGFCGKSGSGKSTLIDVILGLHQYHHGQIHVDGQLLTRKNVRSWQRRLGYVPQAIHLLDGTLAENVAFGIDREEIDDDRVWKVLKDAQLDVFVRSELPDGLNTYVGEKGVRLSGGQRQRIGIARALYRDPEVLVFDEATSALDGVTENLIIDTVCQLSDRMTVLMIAHRLSSLRFCDHIYYIVDGSVAQEGSYPQMLTECDYFSNIETARSD